MELVVDIDRWERREELDGATGFYVRAKIPDIGWEAVDIALLTKESLLEWLAKFGEMNSAHINIILLMLGHTTILP